MEKGAAIRIIGIDTNSFFLAVSLIEDGKFSGSYLFPPDGPARRYDQPKRDGSKNKVYENRSALERLDAMADGFSTWLPRPTAVGAIDYAYIEAPPFVNNVKTFAELTAVVMVTREVLRLDGIGVSLANVSTWKKRTIGNAKADKSEIRAWALAHIPDIPDTLTEDEMDAAVIAFGGAVAAGDVRS